MDRLVTCGTSVAGIQQAEERDLAAETKETERFDPVTAAEGRRKKGVVRYLHTGQGGLIDVAGSIDPRIPPVKGIIPTPKWASAPIPLDLLIPIRYLKPPARPPRR